MMKMSKLMEVHEFLFRERAWISGLDESLFETLVCVMMEGWCKANNVDVVDMANTIADVVKMVNDEADE